MNRKGVLTAETAMVMPVLVGVVIMAAGLLLGGAIRARGTAQAAREAYRAAAEPSWGAIRPPAARYVIDRMEGDGRSIERIVAWQDAPLCLFLPGSPEIRVGWALARYDPVARIRQVDAAVRLAGQVFGRIGSGIQASKSSKPEQEPVADAPGGL